MDLPFAQKRCCGAAGVKAVRTFSDYQKADFGKTWGVLIKDLRLLARAVFIVDKDGIVKYVQVVPEVTKEPNYDEVLTALRALV
jgi:thiol peroxidase